MNRRFTFVFMLCFLSFVYSWCQEEQLLKQVQQEEQTAIEAIALYPENTRTAILEASAHPEILVRMQYMREKTEKQFRELIIKLPQEDQKILFNLSRYPQLIEGICRDNNKKSPGEVEYLTSAYPDDIREQASLANRKYFDELISMNNLYSSSQEAFQELIGRYPEQTRLAYNSLISLPEVVSILNENISLTLLLGDIYKNHPIELKEELDSLNLIVAEQKSKELNEWKRHLEENPEAMSEFEEASREFTHDELYDDKEYPFYEEVHVEEVYIHHVWQPYPYWFGWPWWYTYECWYPYPWWVHSGFYYGPRNTVVFVGLPSNFFMHWHFSHHFHFYHFPRFTNHLVDYYYGHRTTSSSVTSAVRKWEAEIRNEVPKTWFDDDGNRVNRIKEYGRFMMDYQSVIKENDDKAPSRRDFLKKNENKYPTMKPLLKERKEELFDEYPSERKPREKVQEPRLPKYEPRKKIIEKKLSEYQTIDRARNFHQNTWEKVSPQSKREALQPKPPSPVNSPQKQSPRKIQKPKN